MEGGKTLLDRLEELEESLEYQFLYESDSDSIHLLLSILDLDHPTSNLQPRYVLMKAINTSLFRALSDRKDRYFIMRAIQKLINDDVHRFELAICLKAYPLGREQSMDWVDKLERVALEAYTPQELKHQQILFQTAKKGPAMNVQSQLYHWLKVQTHNYKDLYRFCNIFSQKVVKTKIYRANHYLDRQIVLDFDHLSQLTSEESILTIKDLNFIYRKFRQYLASNACRIYKDNIWNGVNDAVLERYMR